LLTIVAENPQGARTIREQRPRVQKGAEGISATTENIENIKASIQERRPLNVPALIGRWPSMQLGGGATSCWHFDGGFIGGEQPYQQIPQGNQIPDGRRDARAHDEVDLGLSLKQWLRPRPWVGKHDDSAITYPVNIHWAVANHLRHHLRIVYFWLWHTVRHTESPLVWFALHTIYPIPHASIALGL
jgi:hypothetical protein